jgi:acylphosphatase
MTTDSAGGERSPERAHAIARRAIVAGRVQGVAFRHYTKLRARELGLVGFVRNLDDGDVEVWAEGSESSVAELVRWLEHGPPAARVESVSVSEVELSRANRFEVQR